VEFVAWRCAAQLCTAPPRPPYRPLNLFVELPAGWRDGVTFWHSPPPWRWVPHGRTPWVTAVLGITGPAFGRQALPTAAPVASCRHLPHHYSPAWWSGGRWEIYHRRCDTRTRAVSFCRLNVLNIPGRTLFSRQFIHYRIRVPTVLRRARWVSDRADHPPPRFCVVLDIVIFQYIPHLP